MSNTAFYLCLGFSDMQKVSKTMQGPVGPFSGNIIPENATVEQALQALETAVESGGGGSSGANSHQDIFVGDGVKTTFYLSANPGTLENLDVTIGGLGQFPEDNYMWDGNLSITFTEPVPSGIKVVVRYLEAVTLVIPDAASIATQPFGGGIIPDGASTQEALEVLETQVALRAPRDLATPSVAGLLSGLDKAKLDAILEGEISPEWAITAPRGTLYRRRNGGPGSSFYVKTGNDTASNGWKEPFSFRQDAVGGVDWLIADKLTEIAISPTDFGAVYDGVTDDSHALQKAVEFVQYLGGGCIEIPTGQMLINSTVFITGSGVSIRGKNHGSSMIVNGQADKPAIQFGTVGAALAYRNQLRDLVFGQKADVAAVAGNCGVLVLNNSNFRLNNIEALQIPGELYDIVIFDNVKGSVVSDIGLQRAKNRCFTIRNQCLDIYANSCRTDGGRIGLEISDSQGMFFQGWAAYGNKKHAFNFITLGNIPADGYPNRFFYFFGCVGDTSGDHNCNIANLTTAAFTGCWFATQIFQNEFLEACGVYMSGPQVRGITLNGCEIQSNNFHGVFIDSARGIRILGCSIGNGSSMEDWGGVGGNNGKGGAGCGVKIGADVNFVNIVGGHYENNTDFAIDIDSGAGRISISDVDLRWNIHGGIRNNGNLISHNVKITNCAGHNPVGYISGITVPSSGVEAINLQGSDAVVYINGGSVSQIAVDDTAVAFASPAMIFLPAGAKVEMTYTEAPSWVWMVS